MKIIDKNTLRDMPAGTLYSRYEPCCFHDLEIFEGPFAENDFIYSFLSAPDINGSGGDSSDFMKEMENGESHEVELNSTGRDGRYDDDELFAIWEKSDVQALIAKLNDSLERAYKQ